jgi:hypothetical protein
MTKKRICALTLGMSVLGAAYAEPAHAQSFRVVDQTWDFENYPNTGWWSGGHAGVEFGRAHSGNVSLWIDNWDPTTWNSWNTEVYVDRWQGNAGYCDVSAFVRTSKPFEGSLGLWWDKGSGGLVYLSGTELLTSPDTYVQNGGRFDISSMIANGGGTLLVVFGFWGQNFGCPNNCSNDGMEIDDVHVSCDVFTR